MKRAQHCLTVPRGNPSNLYANARSHTHARRLLGFFFPLYSSLSSCALFFFACIPPPPAFTPFFLLYDCAFFFFFWLAPPFMYTCLSRLFWLSPDLFSYWLLAGVFTKKKPKLTAKAKKEVTSCRQVIYGRFFRHSHTHARSHTSQESLESPFPRKRITKKNRGQDKSDVYIMRHTRREILLCFFLSRYFPFNLLDGLLFSPPSLFTFFLWVFYLVRSLIFFLNFCFPLLLPFTFALLFLFPSIGACACGSRHPSVFLCHSLELCSTPCFLCSPPLITFVATTTSFFLLLFWSEEACVIASVSLSFSLFLYC